MRPTLALLALLVPAAASAAPPDYEGPKSKHEAALGGLEQLAVDCPRLKDASGDIVSIKLFAGTKESKGDYGALARMMDADTMVLASFLVVGKPKVIPSYALRTGPGFTVSMVARPGVSAFVLRDPAAQWLCNTAPEPGAPMALLSSKALGERLAH